MFMKAGLSAELLLVLRVDARSRLPVSTATCLLTELSCRRESCEQLSSALAWFANQVSRRARDDHQFATVDSTDEPGSLALDHFNVIDVIFEMRVPDCTAVFELWTDQVWLARRCLTMKI